MRLRSQRSDPCQFAGAAGSGRSGRPPRRRDWPPARADCRHRARYPAAPCRRRNPSPAESRRSPPGWPGAGGSMASAVAEARQLPRHSWHESGSSAQARWLIKSTGRMPASRVAHFGRQRRQLRRRQAQPVEPGIEVQRPHRVSVPSFASCRGPGRDLVQRIEDGGQPVGDQCRARCRAGPHRARRSGPRGRRAAAPSPPPAGRQRSCRNRPRPSVRATGTAPRP